MNETRKPTVAVLGASANREKYSNKAVRAYLKKGYEVFPVNPSAAEIEGLKCYASIADIPAAIDRVTVYLPPPVGIKMLESIAQKQVKELYINPGAQSDELVAKAKSLGLDPILACSIIEIGLSPSQFD